MNVARLPLEGQVALVTGASRGIGRAIALRLASEGADLALTARTAGALAEVEAEIGRDHPDRRVRCFACDVTDFAAVGRTVESCLAELEHIDILINNAGITRDNLVLRMSEDEWGDVIATNLTGMFNTCRMVAKPMFRQRRGRIVNITSVVGLIGNVGQANYAAAKGGVVAMTFSLARELASRGVAVNAVAPGFIDTDMTRAMTDEARAAMNQRIPMGRIGAADEVAAVVSFLCGPGASYITGEVIRVDGGLAMS